MVYGVVITTTKRHGKWNGGEIPQFLNFKINDHGIKIITGL
jgi:hypothetical protein